MEYHSPSLLFLLFFNFSVGLQPAHKSANAKTIATLDFIERLPKQGAVLKKYKTVSIHNIK